MRTRLGATEVLEDMANHEIPNAFLIRALARGPAEHCEGCGSRMFVQTRTGKCPYCRAGYPPRVDYRWEPEPATLPFAPRLGVPGAQPLPTPHLRAWVTARRASLAVRRARWTRRATGAGSAPLGLPPGQLPSAG